MIRSCVLFFAFLLLFSISLSFADTYTWTDKNGTVHFTENPGSVPKQIRNKALTIEQIEPAQTETTDNPPLATDNLDAEPKITPVLNGEFSPDELFAGRSYAQWERDLSDRESVMNSIRKRIDEIPPLLNNSSASWEEQKRLLDEYKLLLARFKELKTDYFQQVEIARKAGLQVNIQK